MPPFRFNIPFFSYGSPSRVSSGSSSSSPPQAPPTPSSRPPFRPAGIAQPATSLETKSKGPPSLSRVKSNVAVTAASSSASRMPTRLSKQSDQSGSPLKKLESETAEKQKVAVIEKPPVASLERTESEEAQEQQKRNETEKLVEEKKKNLPKNMEDRSKTAQVQQKRNETEKLAVEEKNKNLPKDMEVRSKTVQEQQKSNETEKLAVEEKNKKLPMDMEVRSKTVQEQQNIKETEKLAMEEKNKTLRKNMEDRSKTVQEQQVRKETEKLALQETNKTLQPRGAEDATRGKTTRHITVASESTRDLKPAEIHSDDNHQKTKGLSSGNHGNPRDMNRDGSSSMSRRIKEDIRDGINKLTCGKSNGDEKSVSVYTLTGENRGATMAIGSEVNKKDSEIHIHRGYRSNPDENPNTKTMETEEERKHFKSKNPKDEEAARVTAYVNGNTQAINNSIVLESSVSENDPGIHMDLKFEESKKETVKPPEKKSETATEKMRNEPMVRRRCLRGLLAESSESENPLKPRKHGCRFTCKDKNIENT